MPNNWFATTVIGNGRTPIRACDMQPQTRAFAASKSRGNGEKRENARTRGQITRMLLHGVYTGCGWELRIDDKRERPCMRTNMTATDTIDAYARARDTTADTGVHRDGKQMRRPMARIFEPSTTMENGEWVSKCVSELSSEWVRGRASALVMRKQKTQATNQPRPFSEWVRERASEWASERVGNANTNHTTSYPVVNFDSIATNSQRLAYTWIASAPSKLRTCLQTKTINFPV